MSYFDTEVQTQPACWREAAAFSRSVTAQLPPHGARIAVVGCGTSYYIGQAYASYREASGHGESDAFAASEFPAGRSYDALLAISRSGTTTEVLDRFAERVGGGPRYAITACADTPIAAAADHLVAMPFADEVSLVQTRFATATLALLRAHLGHDVGSLAAQAEQVLAEPLPADPASFDQVVFLGHGAGAAIAQEAGLKLRETAGIWSESYAALEYRHGPISAATARSLVWAIGRVDTDLLRDVAATPATVIDARRDPMIELVAVHRFAAGFAALRGRHIDNPPLLSRSVVLG